MFQSIRWRLAASYAAIILLAVTLMGTLALTFLQRYVDRQERAFLSDNAAAVARQAANYFAPPIRRLALEELAYTSAFLGNSRVRILDENKTVIADSGDQDQPDEFIWLVPSALTEIDTERHGTPPFIMTMPVPRMPGNPRDMREQMPSIRDLPMGTSQVFARRFFTPWGKRFDFEGADRSVPNSPANTPRTFLTVTQPVEIAGVPYGYVELSSPQSLQREAIGTMGTALLFSGLGALAIAIAFGFFIGKTLTDPLRSLAEASRRMAGGDLSARARGERRDEIGALARQFNGMAESLEGSFRDLSVERDSLKRFVADASHELRTPITALSTFTELLQGSAADDPKARAEFLEESGKQLRRLEWITTNLLDLSRLDAGIASLSFGLFDARSLVEEAASALRGRAADKGVSFSITLPAGPITVSCDRERVIMALSNMISNAVKFTPSRGGVRVSAEGGNGKALFRVADDGEGIAPDDLPRIFERFYRGKNGTAEGAGLGLAIVKSVAEAHGGTVGAQSMPGKGSLFTMEIPLSRA
jgi:signal transduction histidine kinase